MSETKSAQEHWHRISRAKCYGIFATFRKIRNRLIDAKNIRFGDSDDCAVARIAKLFMQQMGRLIPA